MSEEARDAARLFVRPYRPSDLAEVRALDARVDPYRREDAAEVEAMYRRAAQAPEPTNRWGDAHDDSGRLDAIEARFLRFCVARQGGGSREGSLVGIVGVQRFEDRPEVGDLEAAERWLKRGDVAELRHLRVAPEHRTRGVARRLCEEIINWTRSQGFGLLVVNTTSAQLPARALYVGLGFREVGVAYLGLYEVVWYEFGL